jgi:hypothetical protein
LSCFEEKNPDKRRFGFVCQQSSLALALLLCSATEAAQLGPVLPTHNFPTDTSFHLSYRFGRIGTNSNFIDRLVTDTLLDQATLTIYRHQLIPEFQPSRKLSIGAIAQYDQMTMVDSQGSVKQNSFSDQYIFTEFRFHDEPGASVGFGAVLKFPLYSNPTIKDLLDSDDSERAILFGDGQFDATVLATSEFWLSEVVRTQFDLGYTLRTDGFAPEMPFMAGVGFVTPKMDLNVRLKGNFSLGQGSVGDDDFKTVRAAFSNSDYAYSAQPWGMSFEPSVTFWISAKWGVNVDYRMSLMGLEAPNYQSITGGLTYRWSETRVPIQRSFREVDIGTDQERGVFEGEASVPTEAEAAPDQEVREEGEGAFEETNTEESSGSEETP